MDLLSSASTKREAKSYLSRFKSKKDGFHRQSAPERPLAPFSKVGVGSEAHLFRTTNGLGGKPNVNGEVNIVPDKLHLALVKIKDPQLLDDQALHGVAHTLSQLNMLSMGCCVVVDIDAATSGTNWRQIAEAQADRLAIAIDSSHGSDARRLDSAIAISTDSPGTPFVFSRKLLLSPLYKGRVVIVVPVGYVEDTQRAVPIPADDIMLALAKEFAGLAYKPSPEDSPEDSARKIKTLQQQISLDRLIILDPLGGIPSLGHALQKSHVFVNLEQEYDQIADELSHGKQIDVSKGEKEARTPVSPLGKSNPLSNFVEEEIVSLPQGPPQNNQPANRETSTELKGHLANLKLVKDTLSYLPPSSSGLITTPRDAASASTDQADSSHSPTVGTRRKRNPLIHNLLTDKPVYSASLPLGRLVANNGSDPSIQPRLTHSTFVKKGMPITMFPDPRIKAWTATNDGQSPISLDDPHIDLPRLVHLIEDSFNRKLDVKHYMERVNNRLAGLIIAGEYEGGAILTWETPPGVPDDGSPESMARMVPYLDKFAVLKRSQGAGGVADIVFNAMVRTCFPKGLCWRSRRNNPVNKWYFERSRGTWKLPDANWTMFWTTPGVPEDQQLFWDYEGVCRTIEPSWADKTRQAD